MLEVCQKKISEEITKHTYLSIIVEETSHVSNIFQMAVGFRYIVQDRPAERFWGFLTPP